jgi:hypothetical protein
MSGKIDLTVDFAKLENRQLLYDIGKALEKGQSAIKKIIDTEDKKLKYDEAKKGAGRLSYAAIEDRKRVIKKMMGDEESGEIVDALFSYMFNSYVQAEQKVEQIMNMDRAEEKMSINNYCGILLDMKNFIGTNREIFWSVLDYLNELKKDNPNALEEGLLKQLNEIVMKFSLLINNFESEYKNNSRKLFTEFIRDYSTSLMGQKIKIGNEVITFEEGTLDNLLLEAEHDISVLDR